jgi:uncharacterized protein YbjT (DUF2867 family)
VTGVTRLLVAGGTGLVGHHVLEQALSDARIASVVAPTRRLLPVHPKLENPLVDFDALPAQADWWRVDAVVCALGTTIRQAGSREAFWRVDVDYVLAIAGYARSAGARSFALNSSVGADAASGNFYLRSKGEAEQRLRDLGYLSLTLVRPSVIGGEREQRRPMEYLSMRLLRTVAPLVPRRYRVAEAEDIAAALINAAVMATPGCRIVESEALHS